MRITPELFSLSPLLAVDRLIPTEGAAFVCAGNDPQLRVDGISAENPLAAGWYALEWHVPLVEGAISGPCLYPDYNGHGLSEHAKLTLPEPGADGRISAIVLFSHPVFFLRVDPSVSPCVFEEGAFALRRIGRCQAALRMLGGMRQSDGSWHGRMALRTTLAMLPLLVSGRVRAAGEACLSVYRRNQMDSDRSYEHWVELYAGGHCLEAAAFPSTSTAPGKDEEAPFFSVVVPVHNTEPRWLRACVQSVLAQSLGDWELVLCDDASSSWSTQRMLAELGGIDPRIHVLRRADNGHICRATNDAILASRGRWVAFLDHDDELAPQALQDMASAIAAHPGAALFYSDEDKIDEDGRRREPNFKPDWNRELLYGQNYLCHLTVVRRSLLDEVGLLRPGFEGSQDHDLVLRCAERLADEQIVHVPKVLYHWRAIEGSTALSGDAKRYAVDAGRRAVVESLARQGIEADVEMLHGGYLRVRRRLPEPAPMVSLVIPTRDRCDLLRAAVESILRITDYPDFEIVVVDNQSSEPDALAYLEVLGDCPKVRVLRYDAPFNFSAICNFAVRQCRGELVALVNNDVEAIHPDWLAEMAARAIEPGVGAVGAMLYYPDDTIQHGGVIVGIGGVAGHVHMHQRRGYDGALGRSRLAQDMTAVTGACLLVRKSTYESVGGFDEDLVVAFNDIDFCLRLVRAGCRNVWTPWAELYHHESLSRGLEDTPEKQARFKCEVRFMQQRWGDALQRDPAYNPNLCLEGQQFAIAFPPRECRPAAGRQRLFIERIADEQCHRG